MTRRNPGPAPCLPIPLSPCLKHRGRYFKRVAKSNRQMTDDDLTRAVLEKVGMTWDQVVEPRATLSDLDPEQLRRFRKLCNLKGRRPAPLAPQRWGERGAG